MTYHVFQLCSSRLVSREDRSLKCRCTRELGHDGWHCDQDMMVSWQDAAPIDDLEQDPDPKEAQCL